MKCRLTKKEEGLQFNKYRHQSILLLWISRLLHNIILDTIHQTNCRFPQFYCSN
ncbi:hypothetical protein PRUPE_5G179100 [Prunus persica]|uniref:Uncharacterized protein n=1 Tax=Prunus persica TaxID=3760 RepID=A0A251PBP7_PRUPE|nr:hypothetical protein PRUPE_5G179100 [Prunus persica]